MKKVDGPWKQAGPFGVLDEQGRLVAAVERRHPDAARNVALIARVPDMVAALRVCLSYFEDNYEEGDITWVDSVRRGAR